MVLDFYSILPLTCALFVLFFGLFILLKNVHSRINQLLFGFCNVCMFFWMFGTFMMFATRGSAESAIFWDRFVYAGVVFMPPFMHHFSLLFTNRAGKQRTLLFFNYLLAFVFLLTSQTSYFVDDLYYYSWGVHTQARILHHVFLGYFFFGTGLFFINLWTYFKKLTDKVAKLQTIYVFVAFAIVIFIGGLAYLFAYGVDTGFPFSYITGIIFPVILFYTATRHHLLGTKVIATEVLVGLTEFLVVMQIFFSTTTLEVVVRVIFAVAVALIGFLLIQSVRKEIQRREQIAELARALEKANLRLQELDQQKTEFLSIASHQLRTPLSILKGYVELIEDGVYGKPNKEMMRVIKNLDVNNENLIKLVDEFLNISRIEQGKTKYIFARADINQLIKKNIEEMREKAASKGLEIIWKKEDGMSRIILDKEKINNVLLNFFDNAVKYSDKGKIKVKAFEYENGITVKIIDEGVGFERGDKVNFFQKFYRGENVKGINVNGTGMGLYVCREFIEGHGGKVWAHSGGIGKGSEFGFWLPRKPERAG